MEEKEQWREKTNLVIAKNLMEQVAELLGGELNITLAAIELQSMKNSSLSMVTSKKTNEFPWESFHIVYN